jgi:hypothetical protein
MVDTTLGWGEEGIELVTTRKMCRHSLLADTRLQVAERVWDSLARIDRHMSKLSGQAERWRTMATDLNVNAALNGDARIQSAMFRIADQYERMARSAEISYEQAVRRNRPLSIKSLDQIWINHTTE